MLSQGVLFTSDTVTFTQKNEKQTNNEDKEEIQSPQKATLSMSKTTKEQREALFSRTSKLCLSLLPNLLVYDAPLILQVAHSSSPVHLALAIILEARRSLGISSEVQNGCRVSDMALLFMAFGDKILACKKARGTSESDQKEQDLLH